MQRGTIEAVARAPARRRLTASAPSPSTPSAATSPRELPDARRRAAIEAVSPEVDAGRFPVKRAVGEGVIVEADIFADGHDLISAVVQYRHASEKQMRETRMTPLSNDRWRRHSLSYHGQH